MNMIWIWSLNLALSLALKFTLNLAIYLNLNLAFQSDLIPALILDLALFFAPTVLNLTLNLYLTLPLSTLSHSQLTQDFLSPFERYFMKLMPLQKTIAPHRGPARLHPFIPSTFFPFLFTANAGLPVPLRAVLHEVNAVAEDDFSSSGSAETASFQPRRLLTIPRA